MSAFGSVSKALHYPNKGQANEVDLYFFAPIDSKLAAQNCSTITKIVPCTLKLKYVIHGLLA